MDFEIRDLGRMAYAESSALQRKLLEGVVTGEAPSTLLLLEHDPVITLGANFHEQNLLLSADELHGRGLELHITERGGDVTYHGPGQLVAYPIFSLPTKDLHKWLRDLEETVIRSLAAFGLQGRRFAPHTGVWIEDEKVCAMGVKVRKWVSMHGLALNCNPDLTPFTYIVPCGIEGYGVTSISQELGRDVGVEAVKPVLVDAFRGVFS